MCPRLLRGVFLCGIVATLIASGAASAFAVDVKDDGEFFSKNALAKANEQIAVLKKETGKELVIETFKTVPADKVDEVAKMEKADRARYFEKWAIERAKDERVKGIYVLITKKPGHVEIEVDRPTREHGFGATERKALRAKFVDGLKTKEADKALSDGIEYAKQTLKSKRRADSPLAVDQRTDARHSEIETPHSPAGPVLERAGGFGWIRWVLIGIVVLVGIRLIGALFRRMSGGGAGAGGAPGYGGGPGYAGGFGGAPSGGGGGGGFLGSVMTGMLGAVAGNWIYNNMFGNTAHAHSQDTGFGGDYANRNIDADRHVDDGAGTDFEGTGGDFDDDSDNDSGGDFGEEDSDGGGDFDDGGDAGDDDLSGVDF